MNINTVNGDTSVILSYIGTFGDKFINSNTPQVYSNIGLNNVRVYIDNTGQYWFIGKEIGIMLGYANTRDAILKFVSIQNKMTVANHDGHSGQRGGAQFIVFITEQGLYELILGSKMPNSDIFRQYVFDLLHKIKEYGDPYENKVPIVDIIPQTARKYIQNRYNQKIDNIEKIHKQEIDNINIKYEQNIKDITGQWNTFHQQKINENNNMWNNHCNNLSQQIYGYQNAINYGNYQYDMLRMDSMKKDREISNLKQELSDTKQELSDFKLQANMVLNVLMEEFNKRNNINQINKPKPITTIDIK